MSVLKPGAYDRSKAWRALRGFCPMASYERLEEIDPLALVKSGKKLVMLDVDNTIVPWKSEAISDSVLRWFESARAAGLELCFISNTRHPARLLRLADRLNVEAFRGPFKPSPSMFRRAVKQFGVRPQEAVMIGDQLMTDIWGASRAGIDAIWVIPMAKREFLGTKVNRMIERWIAAQLKRARHSESEADH